MRLTGKLDKLLKEAAAYCATTTEDFRDILHAPEEAKRRLFVETLATEGAKVFDADDPRCDRDYLETLALPELCEVYKQMVAAGIAAWRATNPPERAAFLALSVDEKIRILTRNGEWKKWRARWN
jgi:hypothetical protein